MTSSTTDLTCRELLELVTGYLERILSVDDRARFESHLNECPYCQIYLEQMRQTIQLLGRLTEEDVEPVAKERLLRLFKDWKTQTP